MPLAGIIWDVDGTLCDTLPLCLDAFRRVYARHTGRDHTDAEILAGFGATEAGTIRKVIPEGWEAAEGEFLAEYERRHDELACAFPGILEGVAALRDRGVRQAVVTGKGLRSAAITLGRLGLAPFFDRVEVGSPDGPIKPAGIRAILDAWDLPPGAVAYVGDTPYDAAAAAEVGAIPVRAAWSATPGGMVEPRYDEAARAARAFTDPRQFFDWALAEVAGPESR